ncbi:trypsin-like peptidase domain-containing protein [Streptomyces roseoverticillatus]|uniref:S1C family serine protease n=1 Tax=Streptomyces roseoverticillatus TaxID=66429 RepID=UPI001F235BED|nr:trypsin-like peptidase domain-containing protein [Streptomyces roseoverticillatus]MCF3102743.1 trypsin-like peptidase domain-containing protein [Streptomyces roseoverticillatus]
MDEGKTRATAPRPQWWSRPRHPAAAEEHEGPQFLDAPPADRPHGPEAETRTLPAYGQEPASEATPRSTHPAEAVTSPLPAYGSGAPGPGPDAASGTAPEQSAHDATRPLPASGQDAAAAGVPASGPGGAPAPGPSAQDTTRPLPAYGQEPASSGGPGPEAAPRHAPDPYGTPPYGQPGPWAPAPPVQRPVTPPQGTVLPPVPPMGTTPPHGTPAPPVPPPHGTPVPPAGVTPAHGTPVPPYPPVAGPWRYDPWGAPQAAPAPRAGEAGPRRGRLVAGALLVALVAGGIGGGVGAFLERDGTIGRHVELPQAGADRSARAPGSIAGIAARTLPGVVTIHVRGGSDQGTGTGFVLDKEGRILTNNHVVEPAGSSGDISVTFNSGQTAKATVVGRDSSYDLAVIKVSGVSGLTPLALGNSDSVRVGDSVIAIGAPYDLAGTVTTGIISAKERPITAGGQKGDGSDVSYVDALQTDAPINPGNSGGPLVDSEARVIGINSAIRSAGDSGELGGGQGGSIGLGFAIPINQAKRVAEELINTGRATHPVIGVTLDMAYSGDGARVNTKNGDGPAVTPGGPGDKAGLQPRDVIKRVDGVSVHSGQELIVKIRSHRPGDRLTLTVERDGTERPVDLTLGSASAR